jgi:hypothetical protein
LGYQVLSLTIFFFINSASNLTNKAPHAFFPHYQVYFERNNAVFCGICLYFEQQTAIRGKSFKKLTFG